jgi:hypothetical protein
MSFEDETVSGRKPGNDNLINIYFKNETVSGKNPETTI